MATRSSSPEPAIDATPLLDNTRGDDWNPQLPQWLSLHGVAQFLWCMSSHQMMWETSMLVRESMAEPLEERQSDWAYSCPVVIPDILWNLAFVMVAIEVLILIIDESSTMPLRLSIAGYAGQCVVHVVCVCVEYRRRHLPRGVTDENMNWISYEN